VLRWGWLLPLVLALGVNANVLFNGFVWDDAIFFVGQTDPALHGDAPAPLSQAYFRPLIEWSYELDRTIWGLNPFGFHLSVYLAHALTTGLFYLSLRRLVRLYRIEESTAVLAAALFAVHPIHAEAVAWVSGRNDVFMTLFILTALYAYLRDREGGSSWAMRLLFAVGCFLSLLSKETAIPFLLIFPVLDFLFHRAGIIRWRGMKDPMPWLWAVIFGVFILYRLSRMELPAVSPGGTAFGGNGITAPMVALGYYLKLLVIPYPLNLFVPELPGGAEGAAVGLIGLAGTILLVWILIRSSRTIVAVGAVWFLLGIAAPLAVPLAGLSATPVAERYAYLASGGFLLLVSRGAVLLWRWVEARRADRIKVQWVFISAGVVVGLLSLLTVARNEVWRDEAVLWEDTTRKSPEAALPQYNLANVYRRRGRPAEAERRYQTALTLRPDSADVYVGLGGALFEQGRFEEAETAYREALKLSPDYVLAHEGLGNVLVKQRRLEDAVREYQTALRMDPAFIEARNNLGITDADLGRYDDAIREFQTALKLQPNHEGIYYNLGNVYLLEGRTQEAVQAFQQALRIKPDFPAARKAMDALPR
jgi:tetratricopeptide (TPR) repeat protein